MIKINNLSKKYGETEVLKNTSYNFKENGLVCLLGASGSGKSTLLNLVAGFDTKYEGSVYFKDEDLSNYNREELCNYRRDNVGFIFQDYHLISGYTVLENILLPCDLIVGSYEEYVKKAEELLIKLGIQDKKFEKIENLSGGQKQRVSIARALIKKPKILLADEPTGALDRKTSMEIMTLLQEISDDILVIVITHDDKICLFADEVIKIDNKEIIQIRTKNKIIKHNSINIDVENNLNKKVDIKSRAKKNFMIHMRQFIIISLAIAIGVSSFILSLSSQNIMKTSIEDFKEKNTAFNNGYIKYLDENKYKNVLDQLLQDKMIEDAYYQYKIENIKLKVDNKEETLPEYIPSPKASQSLSYGVMPRIGKNEIAITPSLAKKFNDDIAKLIGKTIKLKIGNYEIDMYISGIYNGTYDSIIISSEIEKDLYKKVEHDMSITSISYDVKEFEDVISINNKLKEKDISTINANEEVSNLISTFKNLSKLFIVVSALILLIGLGISIVLLSKLQNSRFKEIGLLSALGFNKSHIKGIILYENLMLSSISSIITLLVIGVCIILSKVANLQIDINAMHLIISVIFTFILVSIISMCLSDKLVKTEPAEALRM
ncbi:MAG: ATP-binding cassette domain-containing protein [Clostridium sp.]